MIKKIFLSIFVALFLLTHIATPAKADTWFNQDPINWYKKVYDTSISPEPEIFGERYTAAQVQWIFYSVITFPLTLIGGDAVSCFFSADLTCIAGLIGSTGNSTQKYVSTDSSKTEGALSELFTFLGTERPMSGITYTKQTLRNLKLIPEVKAQTVGFGFSALQPIQNMWAGMRNISYIFLILVTLILAFMVMFRLKISPQVVITAQSAIPKVITAIVLITFSYAIAGFLIDIMYIVIGLFSLLLNNIGLGNNVANFTRLINGPLLPGGALAPNGVGTGVLGEFVFFFFYFLLTSVVVLVGTFGLVLTGINAIAVTLIALTPGINVVLGIALLLVLLIITILLFIHFIRTIWLLIRTLANILLLTVFAPLQILAGVLVESIGFNAWIRNYISNLAVFVVIIILLFFSRYFLAQAMTLTLKEYAGDGLSNLLNPFLGFQLTNIITQDSAGWPPLLGMGTSATAGIVMLAASFVTFILIPRTAEIIQGFITNRPFAFGSAIGEYIQGTQKTISGGIELIGTISRAERERRARGGGTAPVVQEPANPGQPQIP